MSDSKHEAILAIVFGLLVAVGAYVAWYTYARQVKIAQVKQCSYSLEHPKPPTMMRAPDGSLAPVYSIEQCITVVVPPSLLDMIRGHVTFQGIPKSMKVNSYSFEDMLLGNYTLGQDERKPCDQSATTTDCSTLPQQPKPKPYIPPNPWMPIEEWTTTANSPVSLLEFTFSLPPGWHGSVYDKAFAGGLHVLVQRGSSAPGFTIDCPPDGKGLEAATRLSSEERLFAVSRITYTVALEKWTAPGNKPWYFIWIRAHEPGDFSTDASGALCLVEGNATPDIEEALRSMYDTLK